jgi:hypothetical protein
MNLFTSAESQPSVVISGMRLRRSPTALFVPPKCHQRLIRTMVALNETNAVTSQFVYQAWGIEMPTLQEIAAPFQPIVEMLCSVGTFCQPQALIELVVTESSSLGFWLSEVSITTLFHGGDIESHCKPGSGLLSYLWSSSSSCLQSETVDGEADTVNRQDQACSKTGSSTQQEAIDGGASSTPRLGPCPKMADPTSRCGDMDAELVDIGHPNPSGSEPPDISESLSALSIGMGGENTGLHALVSTDCFQPNLPECGLGPNAANTNCTMRSPSTEEDFGDACDDKIDADYWEWDQERQQYRHWREQDSAWAYFPGTLH